MAVTDFFLGPENMAKLKELEQQYQEQYPGLVVDRGSTGVFSDARHAAASQLMSDRLGGGMFGDTMANIGGFAREVPTLVSETLGLTPKGQSLEDIRANALAFNYPSGTTAEEIYADIFSKAAAQQNAASMAGTGYNYGAAQANPMTDGQVNLPGEATAYLLSRASKSVPSDSVSVPSDSVSVPSTSDRMIIPVAKPNVSSPMIDLGFIEPATPIKEAVGITDRGRGMPEGIMSAYEMIGGQRVPLGDVLGKQMALEKSDFVEEPASRFGLGKLLSIAGLLTGSKPIKALAAIANRDRISKAAGTFKDKASSGLASLNKKLRGTNPDGSIRTQAQFEAAREQRRKDKRVANMLDRKAKGKAYSQKNLNKLTTGGSKPGTYTAKGAGSGGSPGGKSIVCTAMYQTTGLQDWKKAMKIWYIYQKKHLTDTHQEGYHWLFKPFVKAMKKSKIVEALGAHVAKHRTQELKHVLFNSKSDKLGKVYNMILEPICFIAGKIKSALGRG